MRGAVQQEQGGALDHAPRRGGHSEPPRGTIPADRLAFEPEIWPLPRRVQAVNLVCSAVCFMVRVVLLIMIRLQ